MVASMRGCDSIISDEPYAGTAKSAEGYLAGVLFKHAKEEGCKIESISSSRISNLRSCFMLYLETDQCSCHEVG